MECEYLPILSFILDKLQKKENILEIGIDFFTIFFLLRKCNDIEIIETVHENLALKLKEEEKKLNVNFYESEEAFELIRNLNKNYDCVFINTDEIMIWKFINELYEKTDVIILYNSQKNNYNWYLVKKIENFIWLDIKMFNPWTSVITNNRDLIRDLTVKFAATVREFV